MLIYGKHCDKAFAQKYYLTDHMKIHAGKKPHSCTECDKADAKKGDLTNSYARTHWGEAI